jgi:hypothetical protein
MAAPALGVGYMKRILLGTVSIGVLSLMTAGLVAVFPPPAVAAEPGDKDYTDGLERLKQDLARLREENAALRERDRLLAENAALKANASSPEHVAAAPARSSPTSRSPKPPSQKPSAATGGIPLHLQKPDADSPLSAYAADVPVAMFKAPPPADKGQTRVWVEGGAIWTGGDPVDVFYPSTGGYLTLFGGSNLPGFFGFRPKLGFEAAGGFDHRISGTPWHVSGEVRYGEGRTSGSNSTSFSLSGLGGGGGGLGSVAFASTATGNDKETHGLVDFAVGRDFGVGKDAVQFKAGIRLAEITANSSASLNSTETFAGITTPVPTLGGGTTTSVTLSSLYNNSSNSSFRGAGPRIGMDGTIPIRDGWVFDYLADAAALFGTQKFEQTTSTTATITPLITTFVFFPGLGGNSGPTVTKLASTVFNADLQFGVGYWINPNVKIAASYRVDAFWGALLTFDAAGNSVKADRYYHGPRLTLTGEF